jgi:hypothetical protein
MSIFGEIPGRTAKALLSEEKNAEYRGLGAERLGALAFSHANILSAKADQGLQAAENETTAPTTISRQDHHDGACGLPVHRQRHHRR